MYMDGLVKMWFCWNSNSRPGHFMHTEKKKVYIQQWNHHFQSSDEISPTHPHTSSCYKFFVHKMLMQIILCVYWLDSFLVFDNWFNIILTSWSTRYCRTHCTSEFWVLHVSKHLRPEPKGYETSKLSGQHEYWKSMGKQDFSRVRQLAGLHL